MKELSDRTPIIFRDGKDWPEAAIFLVFLIAFPFAMVALWRLGSEVVPVYFALPFTLVFLVAVPFMAGRLRAARTRQISFVPAIGVLHVIESRPGRRDHTRADAGEVDRIEFNTTDNDGFWYTASLVLRDGRSFGFAQGNWRPDVSEKYERFAASLRQANPDIRLVETNS